MDLATIGWIVMGWVIVSMAVALVVGRVFRHTTVDVDERNLHAVLTRRRVLRYLRDRKPVVAHCKTPKRKLAGGAG